MEADRFESLPRANQRALLWYHCCVLLARALLVTTAGIPLFARLFGIAQASVEKLRWGCWIAMLVASYIILELVLEQLRRIASRVPDGPASGER